MTGVSIPADVLMLLGISTSAGFLISFTGRTLL
jgi:hypothetical protein